MFDFVWSPVVAMTAGMPTLMAVVVAAVVGAMIASYLGVVAERGFAGSMDGRSVCVCGRQLNWWENVPVLSWALLRGRCLCRESRLPLRYVLTEAALAVVCAAATGLFGVVGFAVGLVGGGAVVWAASRARTARGDGDGPECVTAPGCAGCEPPGCCGCG